MIAISLEVPPKYVEKTGRGPIIWILVLERENIERMQAHDPADIQAIEYMKGPMLNAPIKQLDLVIAYEEDLNEIIRLKEEGIWKLIDWLERGRKILPGDVRPPVPLRRN
jgi:hypothetical protein